MRLLKNKEEGHMPRYLSLFIYSPEARKGLRRIGSRDFGGTRLAV
jgi:hypothetical protein